MKNGKPEEVSNKRSNVAKLSDENCQMNDFEATINDAETRFKSAERMWHEKSAFTRDRL